jgi:Zn-dependent peptidase ImmA (M78 family)
MRFTLAHELGHIVLHRFPRPEMEKEANEFASALLMPAADIRSVLSGRIDLRRLAALKPEWRVSMQGLLYRAQALELIGRSEAGWLWRQFSALRIKLREPPELDFPIEQPGVVGRMIQLHLDTFGISVTDMAAMLHVHEPLINEYYDLKPRSSATRLRLRIVR